MKRIILLGISILFLFNCNHTTETGYVGQQYLLKADVPDEVGPFDYIWKINNLPDGSKLTLPDLKYSENEAQAIFIPDVIGNYVIQVTVWKYNDKLGAITYNYNVVDESSAEESIQQTQDDWLNETVEKKSTATETAITKQDEKVPASDMNKKTSDEVTESLQEKETKIAEPVVDTHKKIEEKVTPITKQDIKETIEANFTIQIAAESKSDSANDLAYRLNTLGFNAYVQEFTTTTNQKVYRVRVGKFETRDDAIQVAERLKTEQGFSTWVTKYQK